MQDNKKIRFFVDAMLGNIAKKLRLLGYDSKYSSDIDDQNLIDTAKDEKRIIISRDENLIKKSEKLGLNSILVTKSVEVEQFLEILRHVNLEISMISGDSARCPKCNHITESIQKRIVKEKVPPRVFDVNEKFWICKKCNQVYWEGTHISNLQKFVGEINERLQ